ncbi:MAG TPA: low temperature requirement protein A [Mycobacterium sp.]|nr:low temperature requirement protein A [Mycobacterium sp.]
MAGRDPHEDNRVATPLELLFDLTFVIAVGVAAAQFAHTLVAGHPGAALAGFGVATFAVCWAWINFSWFASAYDTDDWVYRLTTMLQMVGVIILALGIPPMFASIEHGEHVDNRVVVAGYIVMRIAMVCQWLRAARQDPARRRACLTYAAMITIAQIGWVAALVVHTSVPTTLLVFVALMCVEMFGPYLAENFCGGTPWHAHHIAERYSLFAIIALGEGVVGTVASLSAIVTEQGWSMDAALVVVAGIGLTFGMWWVYFVVPAAPILHVHRERSFWFGYGHMAVIGAIVATGAGLHVAGNYIEHQSTLDSTQTVLALAIPVGAYLALIFALYSYMVRNIDTFHILLAGLSAATLLAAVWLASAGVDMALCLLVVTLAPIVVVIGFELVGHRHAEKAIRTATTGEL